jgi:hypothetical protein
VTPEVAQRMHETAQEKPFTTAEEVAAAAGKDVSSFNYAAPADAPGSLPKELALSSRTYRIVSEGVVKLVDDEGREAQARGGATTVEAVVLFDAAGKPRIQYWNAAPGGATPAVAPPVEAAPANPA